MKDLQKRCRPNGAESVMAKLMHLDEFRPQQNFYGNHRALSSSYIYKSASIGLHRGRLVSNRRLESNNKRDTIFDKSVKKCERNALDDANKSLKSELDIVYKPRLFSTGVNGFKRKSEVRYDLEDAKSRRHSCIVCSRALNRIPERETHRSRFEEFYRNGYMGDNCVNNTKNDLMEHTISEKDVFHSNDKITLEQFQTSFGVNDSVSLSSKTSDMSCSSCVRSEYDNSEASVDGDLQKGDDRFRDDEVSKRNSKAFISNLSAQYVNDDYAYAIEEAFGVEALINELSEEESAYSNCSRIGTPEFRNKLKRTNQHSPDSVLEPFDLQSPALESFDCIGLRLQLQALNYEREETYSEESIMLVSDDDEFEKQLHDLPQDGRNLKRWLGDVESRNFSYIVDVLDEAGYCGEKSFINFKAWNSLESPISPSVFEELEKKYSIQASWQKSERKLLFDCINLGLTGIFDFDACGTTSVKRRVCDGLRRDEVEDEIWLMLISQEKEKNADLSHKAIGKWSEYEEGMNIICREIETSLFDELIMELA